MCALYFGDKRTWHILCLGVLDLGFKAYLQSPATNSSSLFSCEPTRVGALNKNITFFVQDFLGAALLDVDKDTVDVGETRKIEEL